LAGGYAVPEAKIMSKPNSATARADEFDIAATSLEEAREQEPLALFGSIYRELEKGGQWHRPRPGLRCEKHFRIPS